MRCQRVACIRFVVAFSMVLGASVVAEAQTAAAGPTEVSLPAVGEGQRVWVTTVDGREVAGTLLSLTRFHVVVGGTGADKQILLGDVRKIEVPDSLGNGIRNGAIVGALILGLVGNPLGEMVCAETSTDRYDSRACLHTNTLASHVLKGAIAGGVLGALIDHSIVGRDVIYSAKPTAPVVHVSPMLAPKRAGLGVSISWR